MRAMAIKEMLQRAGNLCRTGQLPQAELLCRKILAEHADQAEALHLLGVCAAQQGRGEEAIALLRQAISAHPSVADYHNNLATLLAGGGLRAGPALGATDRLGEAVWDGPVHFQEALATLYHHLGIDARRTTLADLSGRPHPLVDDHGLIRELIGG